MKSHPGQAPRPAPPFDARLLSGLGVLTAVVEAGSFARAADALGLTPSGVSRAIARLEHRVAIRLFDRTSHATSLTDEGRRFYERVMPHLAEIEDAAIEATAAAGTVRGRLRVNVDPFFAKTVLAPRVGEFLAAHPELSLELATRDRLGDLVAEGFDAAIRFGEPEPTSLIARLLLKLRILTCASPAYLARHGRPKDPGDIGNGRHECILYRDPVTGRPFPWEFHQGRKILKVLVSGRLIVNDATTMLEACAAGHGIAQVMEFGIEKLLADHAFEVLFPDWCDERFPLYAYHPSRHLPPAKVRAFLEFVVALARP
jgi:DNA-binding transcriptional LysR family regulator